MASGVRDVVVDSRPDFRAEVRWPELRDPPCAIYFKVFCQLVGEAGWKCVGKTEASYDTSVVTEVLKPGSWYLFKVVPIKSISHQPIEELQSDPVKAVVTSAVPSTPPRDIVAVDVTDDSFRLKWQPPDKPNGAITLFKLVYDEGESSGGDYNEVHLPPDRTEFVLSPLDAGVTYRVQMLACTAAGDGVESDILTVTTLGGALRRWDSSAAGAGSPRAAEGATPRAQSPASAVSTPSSIAGRSRPALPDILDRDFSTTEPERPRRVGSRHGWSPMRAQDSPSSKAEAAAAAAAAAAEAEAKVGGAGAEQGRAHIPRRRTLNLDDWQRRRREATDGGDGGPAEGAGTPAGKGGSGDAGAQPAAPRSKTLRGFVHYGADSNVIFGPVKDELYSARPLSKGVGASSSPAGADKSKLVVLQDGVYVDLHAGTIRGKKNGVRKSLRVITGGSAIADEALRRLYAAEHKDQIVFYTTTLTAVRSTLSACETVAKLFKTLRLKVQVKDVYKSPRFAAELVHRRPGADVPCVFVKYDQWVGGAEELVALHDRGELLPLCYGVPRRPPGEDGCARCGGAGYLVCSWCQGSGKSTQVAMVSKALRCTLCSDNGLQKCPDC